MELLDSNRTSVSKDNSIAYRASRGLHWIGADTTLLPGSYIAKFYDSEYEFQVGRGDRLLTQLKRKSTPSEGLTLERITLAADSQLTKIRLFPTQDGWTAAVLQNMFEQTRSQLVQVITIEAPPARGGPVVMERPGFVWLEVAEQGGDPSRAMTWRNEPEIPAPAYQIEVDNWRPGARPSVTAWWSKAKEPPPIHQSLEVVVGGAVKKSDDGRVSVRADRDASASDSLCVTMECEKIGGKAVPVWVRPELTVGEAGAN
jgi:hypothetical protein